ncbi:MAG: hypothetical protein AVDCRST_MAG67-4006 [uncultured Solirubrobacteraceae bacterium]|uniref:Uncharacterized protein n=1 Tax=uncultured Solirubrobacteraceae bacterium TaxID=1162706 RepID=A0A6J4TRF4_9ACTN|nr:MAG: hypothetical protein AVDCRST_MAG67-4006 [uncultured Solirubrobacteraceae bacterium]
MSTDQGGFLPVNTNVLVQTLVESVHAQVEERRASRELVQTPPSLQADHMLIVDDEHALERALRVSGYLARLVEVELFEPARRPAGWVPEKVAAYRARAETEDDAVAALCGDLALAEPVGKPSPDDPAAMTWQVPGPGGHVRHYLARRAIEELLRDREHPVAGDPADLKRAWVYGYLVRTCEEALADQSTQAPAA